MRAEWIQTAQPAGEEVLLYFHGGGYILGFPEARQAMDEICAFVRARVGRAV